MKTAKAYQSHQSNIFQVQLAIITSTGVSALILTAISPMLATCLISFLAIQLMLSQKNWKNWSVPTEPQIEYPLDFSIKLVLAALTLLTAIFIVQLHVLSQMVLLTTSAVVYGAFLAYPCLQGSQIALDAALRSAVAEMDLDKAQTLLARGADPLAPDGNGNTAFHLAIQDNPDSLNMLKKLEQAPKAPTPEEVWAEIKTLGDEEISSQWVSIAQSTKRWMSERTQPNFYIILQAFKNVWGLYKPRLFQSANRLIDFLRGEVRLPIDKNYQNNAGQTAAALVETVVKDKATQLDLHRYFDPSFESAPTKPSTPPFADKGQSSDNQVPLEDSTLHKTPDDTRKETTNRKPK